MRKDDVGDAVMKNVGALEESEVRMRSVREKNADTIKPLKP